MNSDIQPKSLTLDEIKQMVGEILDYRFEVYERQIQTILLRLKELERGSESS
jgi:hypothetical protein